MKLVRKFIILLLQAAICFSDDERKFLASDIKIPGELLAFENYRFHSESTTNRVIWAKIGGSLSECSKSSCKERINTEHEILSVVPLNIPGHSERHVRSLLLFLDMSGDVLLNIYKKVGKSDYEPRSLPNIIFRDEPLVFASGTDTGHLVLSILGPTNEGVVIWRYDHVRDSWSSSVPNIPNPLHAMSFLDLNGDCIADLAYLDDENHIRVLYNNDRGTRFFSSFSIDINLDLDIDLTIEPRSITFSDLRGRGLQDIILSSATDIWIMKASLAPGSVHHEGCKTSNIIWSSPVRQNYDGGVYASQGKVMIRTGDFDLDRNLNMLFISQQKRVMLAGVREEGGQDVFNVVDATPSTWSKTRDTYIESAAFYDLQGNGQLRILINQKTTAWATYAVSNGMSYNDAFFFKPQAIWGRGMYGAPVMGATLGVRYQDLHGRNRVGKCTQLSQTSHGALQMPFCLYGLGRVVDYLEWLNVGLPNGRTKSFQNLIPNSNLIVIPDTQNQPRQWRLELYVDINFALIAVFSVIFVVCVFLLGTSCFLHHREAKRAKEVTTSETQKINFLTF